MSDQDENSGALSAIMTGVSYATSAEMARSMSVSMNVMDRVMASKSEVYISSPYFIPGPMGVQAFGELRKRNVRVTNSCGNLVWSMMPKASSPMGQTER